jgi:hypothetical protein
MSKFSYTYVIDEKTKIIKKSNISNKYFIYIIFGCIFKFDFYMLNYDN